MSDIAELVSFRFQVPNKHIAEVPQPTWKRLQRFLLDHMGDGGRYKWTGEFDGAGSLFTGEMLQPAVTALQALAMGHDVGQVLDLLDRQ